MAMWDLAGRWAFFLSCLDWLAAKRRLCWADCRRATSWSIQTRNTTQLDQILNTLTAMRWHSNMASSRSVSASLQRNLVRRNPIRVSTQLPRQCFRINSSLSRPRLSSSISRSLGQQRTLSISVPRRFANVDESFDIKSIDRESDEVDVCIVGGGKLGLAVSQDHH